MSEEDAEEDYLAAVTSQQRGAVATTAVATLARPKVVPGRSRETLPDRIVAEWGACYRCGQRGHFANDCLLESKALRARRDSKCSACNGPIRRGEKITRYAGSWAHEACKVSTVIVEDREAMRRKAMRMLEGDATLADEVKATKKKNFFGF